MAEFSYLWTTTGTPSGDQVASYTQSHWSTIGRILAASGGFEGVANQYDNEMACSDGGANTVDVASGAATVDGKPYDNTATVNVNVPSAVGGGNTRIDRIVLRATWASFTVRITRIAGTDAASPTPPAITQTRGTTYDIKLCQALVDTSGNITVTDERDWCIPEVDDSTLENNAGVLRVKASGITANEIATNAVDSAEINANAVGTSELAANSVDDTIVGNRVIMLPERQGGNATNWNVGGSTDYTPTTIKMYVGAESVADVAAGSFQSFTVTFPAAFSAKPLVVASVNNVGTGDELYCNITSDSTTTFGGSVHSLESSGTATGIRVNWIAIGPE